MDASGDAPVRSAKNWAEVITQPLVELRREVWASLNEAKGKTSWEKFIQTWHPKASSEKLRVVEARWRRGLDPEDETKIDAMDIGEALASLYTMHSRIPEGVAPRVRRLLNGEPEPLRRIAELLYPENVFAQSVSGLYGAWRLVQVSSDGHEFIVWRIDITQPLERTGGPGAWFCMQTRLPDGVVRQGRRDLVLKSVHGTAHAVGATFYLIGADCDRRPVTSSFSLFGGELPQDDFAHAHGIVQRAGSRGHYASRALLRRVDAASEVEIGLFPRAGADIPQTLADDISTLTEGAKSAGDTLHLLAQTAHPGG